MKPATGPRPARTDERLLWIDPASHQWQDRLVGDLADLLAPGDLLVLNDSATLPASLPATADGEALEVRLCVFQPDRTWLVALFGAGDWHQRTEDRGAPPSLHAGSRIRFSGDSSAVVVSLSAWSPRLVTMRFEEEGAALWESLYALGRPIQYSYLRSDLALWDAQTCYAERPWSVEMPSAGRPLTWALLAKLRQRGVEWATLTHAAGISSLGEPALDALLPFPERFEIPASTLERIARAKQRGGRVIAAGTTVVRALEGCAASGGLRPGAGVTDVKVGPDTRPRIVDALFTGMHEPNTSHFRLLEAFVPKETLAGAYAHAEEAGYLGHEFGDSTLVLRSRLSAPTRTSH